MIIIIIAGFVYLGAWQQKKTKVKICIDESIDHLWISIGITYFALSLIFTKIIYEKAFTFYIPLYGIGCFVTGRLIKFTPLVWDGIAAWLLAILLAYLDDVTNILITIVSILNSYIIPGYLLRVKYKKITTD